MKLQYGCVWQIPTEEAIGTVKWVIREHQSFVLCDTVLPDWAHTGYVKWTDNLPQAALGKHMPFSLIISDGF